MEDEPGSAQANPSPSDRRARLDRDRVVAAAVELLDEVGLTDFSTRRLADRLGIRSPSLYWHVRDKDELLDLVAEHLCADAFDIDPTDPWRTQVQAGMEQFRRLVTNHPYLATLLRDRPATGPNRLGHIEATLRILLGAGVSADDAAGISRLLLAHVLALPPPVAPAEERDDGAGDPLAHYPSLRQVAPALSRLSEDDLFHLGIDLVLDGVERRITSSSDRDAIARVAAPSSGE